MFCPQSVSSLNASHAAADSEPPVRTQCHLRNAQTKATGRSRSKMKRGSELPGKIVSMFDVVHCLPYPRQGAIYKAVVVIMRRQSTWMENSAIKHHVCLLIDNLLPHTRSHAREPSVPYVHWLHFSF